MRNLRALALALFASLVLVPLQALATTCWHPEPDEYLSAVRLAFKGKVISVGPGTQVRFYVIKLWKGNATKEVEASYSYPYHDLKVGKEVTVIADSPSPGVYNADICMMVPYHNDSRYESALKAYRAKLDSFAGADFNGAKLENADFSRAKINSASFRGACFTAETKWPDGFNPVVAGAKLVGERTPCFPIKH